MYNMYFTSTTLVIVGLIREPLYGDAVLLTDHEEPVTVYPYYSRAYMRTLVDERVHTTTEGTRPRGRVLWWHDANGDIPEWQQRGEFHPYK